MKVTRIWADRSVVPRLWIAGPRRGATANEVYQEEYASDAISRDLHFQRGKTRSPGLPQCVN